MTFVSFWAGKGFSLRFRGPDFFKSNDSFKPARSQSESGVFRALNPLTQKQLLCEQNWTLLHERDLEVSISIQYFDLMINFTR